MRYGKNIAIILWQKGNENSWFFSPHHGKLCQVIEPQAFWCKTICRVWLPGRDPVVRLPARRLTSLENSGVGTADGITYVASAARIADAQTQDVVLTPIGGPRLSTELAPAGTTHLERGTQAQGSGVAGDSAPSGHPG